MFLALKDTDENPVIINSDHIVYYRPTENDTITYIQLSRSEENKDFMHVMESVERINKILKVKSP